MNPYFTYNLPLQVWPHREGDDENSPVVGTRILNYMPRKEACINLDLEDVLAEGQTREEFFEEAAQLLEHLAGLMRAAGKDPTLTVYYHDEGFEERRTR